MNFIDTNYFVRFLLHDVEPQFLEAKNTFEKGILGKEKLFSSTIVFFEIYWLFQSLFGKPKEEIFDVLTGILDMKFIYFNEYEILKKSMEIYKNTNLGLEDSYNLIFAQY